MSKWRQAKLGEVCKFTAGSAFKPEYQGQVHGEHPFIKVSDMNLPGNEIFITRANNFISEAQRTELAAKLHPEGATAFAKIGIALTTNRRRLLTRPTIIDNNMMSATPDITKITPRYLYFLLNTLDFNTIASGSALPYINVSDLQKIDIELPGISEQRACENLLGSIDDKLELSQRMNEALEEMARALFKSWFVDFDPVRAKAEGRKPEGMDAATAALFPATFNDDGLPEEWIENPMIDSAEYINGAAYKNMHFSNAEDALPVIKIAELKNGITAQTKFTNTELGKKYKLVTGDILFSWSGSPDTSINTFIWTGGYAWLNQHIFKVVNKTKEERCFTYWLLKHLNPIFIEIARDKQTTGLGHVTKKDMERLIYVRPTAKVLYLFYQVAGPIMDRIQSNMIEEGNLIKIRDVLLPKLISGELRIEDKVISIVDRLKQQALQSCIKKGYTDIRCICNDNGITVTEDNTVSKAQIIFDGKFHIKTAKATDNYSIAHELGHFALHPEDVKKYAVGRKDEYSLSKDKERQAEEFASELMMPETYLRDCLAQEGFADDSQIGDKTIKSYAKKFHVSEPAMRYRLNNLGYKTAYKDYTKAAK